METIAYLRILAHTLSFGFFFALGMMEVLQHGTHLRQDYWPWMILSRIMYMMWFAVLALSVGEMPIERKYIVQTLMTLELSGAVLGWLWLIATFKATFKITRNRNGNYNRRIPQ